MKTLYVNGCSHTAGSECNTNYANIIGQKLNYKVINKATPGGGNHKIYRETMEYLCNDNHPVDFVIIGWTTHERFEFSFDGENTDYTLYKESYNKELEKFSDELKKKEQWVVISKIDKVSEDKRKQIEKPR